MPFYTFRCGSCGEAYDKLLPVRKMYKGLRTDCPDTACGGYGRRVYSAPYVAMVPGTYTRYQAELDRKAQARAKRKEKAIREAKRRGA